MQQIQPPDNFDSSFIFSLIVQNMRDDDLEEKLNNVENQDYINSIWNQYDEYALSRSLCYILPYTRNDVITPIFGNLSKHDFIKLYKNYFSKKGTEIRKIYDDILAKSERCPYCGGVGISSQLDHYLPKTYYPQYSVYPRNLIPSCRDCNEIFKRSNYAQIENQQLIHSYFDKQCFFSEQWICANYIADHLCDEHAYVQYFVQVPSTWSDIDKQRAQLHFDSFNLEQRFAMEANNTLQSTIPQIRQMLESGNTYSTIMSIYDPDNSHRPINHWERVMYQALCNYIKKLLLQT